MKLFKHLTYSIITTIGIMLIVISCEKPAIEEPEQIQEQKQTETTSKTKTGASSYNKAGTLCTNEVWYGIRSMADIYVSNDSESLIINARGKYDCYIAGAYVFAGNLVDAPVNADGTYNINAFPTVIEYAEPLSKNQEIEISYSESWGDCFSFLINLHVIAIDENGNVTDEQYAWVIDEDRNPELSHCFVNCGDDGDDTDDNGDSDCEAISLPLSIDGDSEYCFETTDDIATINSWELASLTINGVEFGNAYILADRLPEKIDGKYYISYIGRFAWSHAEIALAENTVNSGDEAISLPFVKEGMGEFTYVVDGPVNYINSWNMEYLEVNGVDFTNRYSSAIPASSDGRVHITYVGNFAWSHFEIR